MLTLYPAVGVTSAKSALYSANNQNKYTTANTYRA